jgi:hypothetical protein
VCGAAELKPFKDNVAKCEMKHFAMLRAPQARKWIAARSNLKTKEINDLKKPCTALQDAEAGVKNCISVAFSLRAVKSRLLADIIEEVPNEVAPACTTNSPPAVYVLLDPTSADIKPSEILQDPSKVALLLEAFDPKGLLARIDYLMRLLEKALVDKVDLLYRKL